MTVQARVLSRFPARIEVGAGLDVVRAAGVYTFSLDFESLTPSTSIANGDTTYIPAWDSDQDAYTRLTANAFGQVMAAGFSGTSSSTVTVGDGSKTFTASTGKGWTVGQRLRVANADDSRVMSGVVTSYDAVSGELIIDVDFHVGSSSDSSWTIVIGGEVGPEGDAGAGSGDVVGPDGATDGVLALFDTSTGKLLKEGAGAPGALALEDTIGTSLIDDDAVTYAKIQNVSATDKLLGRSTAGAGNIEEITCTAAGRALLDDAAASNQRTTLGLGDAATLNLASQGQAEAGTSNTTLMTPLRTAEAIAELAGAGALKGVQVFTSSGTYTPTSGASSALVIVTGGGGGGSAGLGSGGGRTGEGGGAGATAIYFASSLSSTSITIGAAGSSSGGNGGQSAFGTVTANGGSGSAGGTTTAGATVAISGGDGGGKVFGQQISGGTGGASFWGGGGQGGAANTSTDATSGRAWGSGGGGGGSTASGVNSSAAGKAGVVVVLEW